MAGDNAPPPLDPQGVAVVFGARGGIGGALAAAITTSGQFREVAAFSRQSEPPFDLLQESLIKACVEEACQRGDIRLAIDATGFLHSPEASPERSWRELSADQLAQAFAINATGPALLMKHLLPRLPRRGKAVFATLSARVGSIGDNRLGGWYSYRASKAALNQLVKSASIELARRAPEAFCIALHPGTVATPLSAPFAKAGLEVFSPEQAASQLLTVVDRLKPGDNGGFFDWRGDPICW